MSICTINGIPIELHSHDREPVQNFEPAENLYHRVSEFNELGQPNILEGGYISGIAFRHLKGMSCNRSQYSNPADVLYNTKDGSIMNARILGASVEDLQNIEAWIHPIIKDKTFSLVIWHEPTPCMYPHTELRINRTNPDGENIDPPDTLIESIRSSYADVFNLIEN